MLLTSVFDDHMILDFQNKIHFKSRYNIIKHILVRGKQSHYFNKYINYCFRKGAVQIFVDGKDMNHMYTI